MIRRRNILLLFLLLPILLFPNASESYQKPSPGEIEQYKKDGTYQDRLEHALSTGNHKIAPGLVEGFKQKKKQIELQLQGGSALDVGTVLPPGDRGQLPSTVPVKVPVILIGFANYQHGKPDILWQDATAGYLLVWYMNGATMTSYSYLNPSQVADTNWKIVAP